MISNSFVLCLSMILLCRAYASASDSHTHFRLVTKTVGVLGAGNFSHYSLGDRGTFKLVLISNEGDADLYVSDKHPRVDFSNYDYQSTTYGEDIVYITEDMDRPVYVSVYAHPYYHQTAFTLYQYEINTKQKSFINELDILSNNAYFEFANDEFSRIDNEKNAREQTYSEHYDHHNDQGHSREKKSSRYDESVEKKAFQGRQIEDEEDENYPNSFFFKLLIHLIEFIADILL
jgi:hypothetical protein